MCACASEERKIQPKQKQQQTETMAKMFLPMTVKVGPSAEIAARKQK
jgi:hypothetical protein